MSALISSDCLLTSATDWARLTSEDCVRSGIDGCSGPVDLVRTKECIILVISSACKSMNMHANERASVCVCKCECVHTRIHVHNGTLERACACPHTCLHECVRARARADASNTHRVSKPNQTNQTNKAASARGTWACRAAATSAPRARAACCLRRSATVLSASCDWHDRGASAEHDACGCLRTNNTKKEIYRKLLSQRLDFVFCSRIHLI